MKLFNRNETSEKLEDIKDAIIIYMKPNKVYTMADLLLSVEECKDLTNARLYYILNKMVKEEKIIGKTEIIRERRKLIGYYTTIHA